MRTPALLAGALLLAPAIAAAEDQAPAPGSDVRPPTLGWIGDAVKAGRPGTLMQVIPAIGPVEAPGTTTIIYMNKGGATLTPGNNDSRTNRSTVVGQTSAIPAFEGTATEWNNIMTCVREIFSPFDVMITDVDPGNTPHVESLMGGRAQQAGMQQGVLGVSPFTVDCSVIPNPIVFTFTQSTRDAYGSSPALAEEICEIAAQEIAHAFGLDHELLASDPMTYLNYNGLKRFQNVDAQCGESVARTCGLPGTGVICSQRQNSVTMLTQRIGLSDTLAPVVSITSPQNGATVPTAFAVNTDASDNNVITKVELYLDGNLVETLTAAPFSFQLSGLANGGHSLMARAYDSRNQTDSTISVTVQAGAPPPNPNPDPDPNPNPDDTDGDGTSDVITGGCQSGGGDTGGLAVLGLALLGVTMRRRRRA
jgi:uncharacterized protein (TIGR03382 family)